MRRLTTTDVEDCDEWWQDIEKESEFAEVLGERDRTLSEDE